MLDLVGDVDGVLCGDDEITRAVMERAVPRLRAISKYGVGLDKIDLVAAAELQLPVSFCPGVNQVSVAEHVFGLMIALARNILAEDAVIREGSWQRMTGRELAGKQIGIVGLGRVGKEVARRANAFGMVCLGYDETWDAQTTPQVIRAPSLDELFARCDVVSLHLPLTSATRQIVDSRLLALMPGGAYLLNTARGELVVIDAVVDALNSGQLGGYAADVFESEPLPPGHPLIACPNTVLTPHIGSRTHESVRRQALMAAENLVLMLNGQPPHALATMTP